MRLYHSRFLTGLGFLLLTACQDNSDTTTPIDPFPNQYHAQDYNIAYFMDRNSTRDAMLLATQQVNEIGGILNGTTLNLISVDIFNLYSGNTDVVAMTNQMIADYHLPIIGGAYSSTILKLAPLTIPAEILLVSHLSSLPSLSQLADNDLLFRMGPSDIWQGKVLAQLAIERSAPTCTIVRDEGDAFGQSIASVFQQNLVAAGGKVLDEVALPTNRTIGFSEFFPRIYDSHPDCVLLTVLRSSVQANLINEASASYSNVFYLFSDTFNDASFFDNLVNPSVLSNSVGITAGFGPRGSVDFQFVVDNYETRFQHKIDQFVVFAYDLTIILALAIEQAGQINHTTSPTGLMVRDQLRSIVNPPGVRVGPSQLAYALQLIRQGQEIDYVGASNSELGWDSHGDVTGQVVYEVFTYSPTERTLVPTRQIFVEVPLEP